MRHALGQMRTFPSASEVTRPSDEYQLWTEQQEGKPMNIQCQCRHVDCKKLAGVLHSFHGSNFEPIIHSPSLPIPLTGTAVE